MSEQEEELFARPMSTRLVGRVTLEDYANLRDLRLLLWTLKKELCEKYDVKEACEVAERLAPLVGRKVKELEEKMK